MDVRCFNHGFEAAENLCRMCGHGFCAECLVYAFGSDKPPFCLSCALAAAGVRANAARPPAVPKREMKRRQKEFAKMKSEQAKVAAASTTIDWSVPEGSSEAFSWADETNDGGGEQKVAYF